MVLAVLGRFLGRCEQVSLGWITGVSVICSFVASSIAGALGNNQKATLPSLTATPDMVMLSRLPGSCYIRDFIGSILSGKSDHFLPWLRSIQGVARETGVCDYFNVEASGRFLLVCFYWSLGVVNDSLFLVSVI